MNSASAALRYNTAAAMLSPESQETTFRHFCPPGSRLYLVHRKHDDVVRIAAYVITGNSLTRVDQPIPVAVLDRLGWKHFGYSGLCGPSGLEFPADKVAHWDLFIPNGLGREVYGSIAEGRLTATML